MWYLLQYLSAVNYDSKIADLIFIRVNIYPVLGKGGLKLISLPAVNYESVTTDLIFENGQQLPRVKEGESQLFPDMFNFIWITIHPTALTHKIT
jgi:hypothetical protein